MRAELVYWINEREDIRQAKDIGRDKPWSDDPIFQETYFCNVHREDDRTTKYIREYYSSYVHADAFTANICLARLVNRVNSLVALRYMNEFDEDLFRNVNAGLSPFWGNAYVLTTHGRKMSKIDYACEIIQAAFDKTPWMKLDSTLENAHREIMVLEGFASFMAAQVVADLKNTTGHVLKIAPDWHSWSAPGPGSMRGLEWYFGYRVNKQTYHNAMMKVYHDIYDDVPKMCMQDLQNCMCEFDKYLRVKTGTGRSKRKYDGHS